MKNKLENCGSCNPLYGKKRASYKCYFPKLPTWIEGVNEIEKDSYLNSGVPCARYRKK
jgi:hypothetical protein